MIDTDISKEIYTSLSREQRLKLALYSDFEEKAKDVYDFLALNNHQQTITSKQESAYSDGVYYLYKDGSSEYFDYTKRNAPTKEVLRIGVVMGSHSLAVNLEDYPEQSLTCNEDETEYDGYITEYDDAVADWNGKQNTEHIKLIGTDIPLKDDEWIPSVAELYLIYLNKRSINAALELCGGSHIKGGWYWSSSEHSATHAWTLGLSNGYLRHWSHKVSASHYVRAVSAFH